MKKIIIIVCIVISLVFSVFMISDFYATDDSLYIDATDIGINNYSHEDFYTEYLDLIIKNAESEESSEILNESIINSTKVVDGDLEDFINSKPIDFTMYELNADEQKQRGMLAVYYVLNKAGYSNELIAGVLGNVLAEGTTGIFENIPYGSTKYDYYKNSWSVEKYYSQFVNKSGGPQDKEYSVTYANKQVFNINLTGTELKTMLNVGMNEGVAVFGYGPLQATSKYWHTQYINAVDSLNISSAKINESVALQLDATVVKGAADSHFKSGLPSEPRNMAKYGNTYAKVCQKVGVTEESLKTAVSAGAYWAAAVEVCSGYNTIEKLTARGNSAARCYQAIKACGY